jgi:hypothetical protein
VIVKESFGEPRRGADSRSNAMPLELQLDLLVDEELPEDRRRTLLMELDRDSTGAGWRTLSLRFLERQGERRSVRDLIAGGRLLPVEEAPANYKMPRSGWSRWRGVASVAAGLVIAAGSALVTGYWVQQHGGTKPVAANTPEIARANLPGAAVGMHEATPVLEYSVGGDRPFTEGMLAPQMNDDTYRPHDDAYFLKHSVVIQPDGHGKAMVIPVKTLPIEVY